MPAVLILASLEYLGRSFYRHFVRRRNDGSVRNPKQLRVKRTHSGSPKTTGADDHPHKKRKTLEAMETDSRQLSNTDSSWTQKADDHLEDRGEDESSESQLESGSSRSSSVDGQDRVTSVSSGESSESENDELLDKTMGPWKDLLDGFIADFHGLEGDIQYSLIARLHQIGAEDKALELWNTIKGRDRMPGGREYSSAFSRRPTRPTTTVFFSDAGGDEKGHSGGNSKEESFPSLSLGSSSLHKFCPKSKEISDEEGDESPGRNYLCSSGGMPQSRTSASSQSNFIGSGTEQSSTGSSMDVIESSGSQ